MAEETKAPPGLRWLLAVSAGFGLLGSLAWFLAILLGAFVLPIFGIAAHEDYGFLKAGALLGAAFFVIAIANAALAIFDIIAAAKVTEWVGSRPGLLRALFAFHIGGSLLTIAAFHSVGGVIWGLGWLGAWYWGLRQIPRRPPSSPQPPEPLQTSAQDR